MTKSGKPTDPQNPLGDLEEWDDFVKDRYPKPADAESLVGTNQDKTEDQSRDDETETRSSVRDFYRLNHQGQTLDFVQQKSFKCSKNVKTIFNFHLKTQKNCWSLAQNIHNQEKHVIFFLKAFY